MAAGKKLGTCRECGAHIFDPDMPCPACGREKPAEGPLEAAEHGPAVKALKGLGCLLPVIGFLGFYVWMETGCSTEPRDMKRTALVFAGVAGVMLVGGLLKALVRRGRKGK